MRCPYCGVPRAGKCTSGLCSLPRQFQRGLHGTNLIPGLQTPAQTCPKCHPSCWGCPPLWAPRQQRAVRTGLGVSSAWQVLEVSRTNLLTMRAASAGFGGRAVCEPCRQAPTPTAAPRVANRVTEADPLPRGTGKVTLWEKLQVRKASQGTANPKPWDRR